MNTTLPLLPAVSPVDPTETSIIVRCFPAALSDAALAELHDIAKPRGNGHDGLRIWIRGCVDAEIARRNCERGELEEPAAWRCPWHSWNDEELLHALAASFSWLGLRGLHESTATVLVEVHAAVLTAACTRLYELHTAIENAKVKGQR